MALLAAARDGDATAANRLVGRHLDAIYGYTLSRTRQPEVAADLAQDVFVKAQRALARFTDQGGGSLRPWLLAIASNTVKDHWKSAAARHASAADVPDRPELDDGPAVQAVQAELVRLINALLDTLGESHRQVLQLRFLEGRTIKETAAEMGRTPGAITVLQTRALKAARKAAAEAQALLEFTVGLDEDVSETTRLSRSPTDNPHVSTTPATEHD